VKGTPKKRTRKVNRAAPRLIEPTEAERLRPYYRSFLNGWHARTLHILRQLNGEAEDMKAEAEREPAGPMAEFGANQFDLYESALGHAVVALMDMLPLFDGPLVFENVAARLARLKRERPWEGGDA
jgi:hypothetical protein